MANLQNLDQRFPIVDPQTGQPTDYFMRLLRNQTGALADASDGLENDVEQAESTLGTIHVTRVVLVLGALCVRFAHFQVVEMQSAHPTEVTD